MDKQICQEIEPLLPATAAGALDPEEQAEIQAHLAYCGFCIRRLHEYEETVVQLAYAVQQVQPPSALRGRVMAIATGRVSVESETAALPFQPRATGIPEPAPASRRGSLLDVLGGFYRRLAPAGMAFSVILLLFSGTALLSMSQQIDGMRRTVNATDEIKQVLATDGAIKADLKSKSSSSKETGQVIMAPGQKQVVLVADHLPTPSAGKSLRLWMLHRDQPPVAAGKVDVDDKGVAMCTVDVPEDPTSAEGVAVSQEQDGVTPAQPTVVLEGWYK